jgi:hypothetical protein
MKKTIAKKTSKKKAPTPKKVVAKKTKPIKKENVVAFKKPKAQQEKPAAPAPKPHPFSAFMKDRFSSRNFSVNTRKIGSQDVYRKKAV